MTDTAADRRQKRIVDRLRAARVELTDAAIEVAGREDRQARAIRNALVATEYALKPPTSVLSSKPVSDDPIGADK